AALARDTADGTAPAGPHLRHLLELTQALLTDRLPALPGQPVPGPDLPVDGSGTPDVPWRVPIHRSGEDTVELLTWLEPAGPPGTWALDPLLDRYLTVTDGGPGEEPEPAQVGADEGAGPDPSRSPLTGADVLAAGRFAGAYRPDLAELLSIVEPAPAALAVDALADLLAEGDGLVSVDSSAAAGVRLGDLVDAAHHELPADPATVTQLHRAIGEYAVPAGDDWAVLLLAPPLAGSRPWEPLLGGVPAGDVYRVDLRVPGTSPDRVDLGALSAARWYVVDLGDDGTLPAATALAALRRIHDAVRAVRPGTRTILVGHSYLGQVARQLAAAVPTQVLGLVTIGTPADNSVLPVDAPVVAEGVRLARLITPEGTADGPATDAALGLLARLLDGHTVTDRQAATALPLPSAAFARWTPPTTPLAVPALAIHGRLRTDLRELLANALTWRTSAAVDALDLPTAAAGALRVGLDLGPAQPGDPRVDADIRLDLGRVALAPDTEAEPGTLQVRLQVSRPDGWLLGGPGDGRPLDARVRAMTVRTTVTATGTSVSVLLHDVAVRGDSAAVVDLTDPRTPPLLDALLRELDRTAKAGGRLARLLDELAALGIVRRAGSSQPAAVLADDIAGLTGDPAAFLAARLPG
ncbi:alpha/beta hydrolase family protein, partial [Micromonospora sonneratiae]